MCSEEHITHEMSARANVFELIIGGLSVPSISREDEEKSKSRVNATTSILSLEECEDC